MSYQANQISKLSSLLAKVLRDPHKPLQLVEAASCIIEFQAALCVVNRRHHKPLYLCDTYSDKQAKQAIKLYTKSTYLINPVYNSFLSGLGTGLRRMRDLAPDNWNENALSKATNMSLDSAEEIGFLTRGWPSGLEELVLTSRISDECMVEISFAQPVSVGGFSDNDIDHLKAFIPLFSLAMDAVCQHALGNTPNDTSLDVQLEAFASEQLTQRESEVVQLILKGHSGKSICKHLFISMPTLKSHRKNAYVKLGITNLQELFSLFIHWKYEMDHS
ncbi:MAG: helix-turn-helix transcriptional regulator [Arenicella sp.]|nr:helix-turn-helix transcriptional regulator [Arenicella sp.]